MNSKPKGYVVYHGPSLLNGEQIVVVALTNTRNAKTGNMVQTYILVDNGKRPGDNTRSLEDVAICGDCPHRHGTGGSCYVNEGRGPAQVYKGFLRGIYPHSMAGAITAAKGRHVRLGTYGDPAAVPVHVWETLVKFSSGHTGYTHQWRTATEYKHLCMASVDSAEERELARSMGWRTFRVRGENEPLGLKEFACPAAAESGYRLTCDTCMACSGGEGGKKADPAIVVHGILAVRFSKQQNLILKLGD